MYEINYKPCRVQAGWSLAPGDHTKDCLSIQVEDMDGLFMFDLHVPLADVGNLLAGKSHRLASVATSLSEEEA